MILREEKSADYDKVYSLVQKAFEQAEHRDGNEQDLVCALRKSEAFIQSSCEQVIVHQNPYDTL